MFRSVLADVSNIWQFVCSASAIGSQPISWVYVGILRSVLQSISWVFATHLWNVRNVFVFCMLHIRITKVWFLSCKKGVFELQKYGFCFLSVALLQSVRSVLAIRSPHYGNP